MVAPDEFFTAEWSSWCSSSARPCAPVGCAHIANSAFAGEDVAELLYGDPQSVPSMSTWMCPQFWSPPQVSASLKFVAVNPTSTVLFTSVPSVVVLPAAGDVMVMVAVLPLEPPQAASSSASARP